MRSLLIFLLLPISVALSAQGAVLRGNVSDGHEGLSYVTIILKQANDSSIYKTGVTDDDGNFELQGLAAGRYFVQTSLLGQGSHTSAPFTLSEEGYTLPPITLQPMDNELAEAVVEVRRPIVEVHADKTVFNVDKTINATGSNGFELLRKAPGVVVDNNENVIVDGKAGVQIYINGKPSPLSSKDLASFLKSLPASSIDAIEIITQPSAKYDAEGTAGIINIKLKKEKGLGTNGSAALTMVQGQRGRYQGSVSINHRTKKDNIYANFNAGTGTHWNFMDMDRKQEGGRFDSESVITNNFKDMYTQLGWDHDINDKHTFGVLLSGGVNNSDYGAKTTTKIGRLDVDTIQQTLFAQTTGPENFYNFNANINYQIDNKNGQEFLFNADYGQYVNNANNYQPNRYIDGEAGAELAEDNYRMRKDARVDIATAKVDYSNPLAGGVLSAGAKFSWVKTNNNFGFFNEVNGQDVFNAERSNDFQYIENINAAYVSYKQRYKKWSWQAGLRAEQTNSEGKLTSTQKSNENLVARHYLDFFPSAGLSFTPSEMSAWSLSYSRRIQRPDYSELNPFEFQVDALSFRKGNPFLQPQYTHNIKLSHTWAYTLSTSLSYSHINNYFAQISDTVGTDRTFISSRNIAEQQVWSFSVSSPFQVTKWWSGYASATASNSSFKSNNAKFSPISLTTMNLYAQQTFQLPKGWILELSGWFSSPSVWGGTYLTQSLGAVNLGVQRKFLKDRLTLRLAVNDIFFSSPWHADMQFGDLQIDVHGGGDSRRVSLSASYRFGDDEVKQARERSTGLEDEAGRVGN